MVHCSSMSRWSTQRRVHVVKKCYKFSKLPFFTLSALTLEPFNRFPNFKKISKCKKQGFILVCKKLNFYFLKIFLFANKKLQDFVNTRYYQPDSLQFTDNLTNFDRINSCSWITIWLKVFGLNYLSIFEHTTPTEQQLQDYRTLLHKFLSLPSVPKDLENSPDFLLEPTLLIQLPWSPVLLQQWLAAALLELTKFETQCAELRHWPMVEELAVLSTRLLNLVRVLKDRLLLGLAVLSRDVTTFPTIHFNRPILLLEEVVLPSVPVLRFLIQGKAYTMLNQIKREAFSTSHAKSEFGKLRTVNPLCSAAQRWLLVHFMHHHFNIFFWIDPQKTKPYPPSVYFHYYDEIVKGIGHFANLNPPTCKFDPTDSTQEEVEVCDDVRKMCKEFERWVTPDPTEDVTWEPVISMMYSLVSQLRDGGPLSGEGSSTCHISSSDGRPSSSGEASSNGGPSSTGGSSSSGGPSSDGGPFFSGGPSSLYRSLVMMTGEYYMRDREILQEKDDIFYKGFTPTVTDLPSTPPFDLESCHSTLSLVRQDVVALNQCWLRSQLPILQSFDPSLDDQLVMKRLIVDEDSEDGLSLIQSIDRLIWNNVLFVYEGLFPIAQNRLSVLDFIEIYTFKVQPLIFLQGYPSVKSAQIRKMPRIVIFKYVAVMIRSFSKYAAMLRHDGPTNLEDLPYDHLQLTDTRVENARAEYKLLEIRREMYHHLGNILAKICRVEDTNRKYLASLVEFTTCLTPEMPRNDPELLLYIFGMHISANIWDRENYLNAELVLHDAVEDTPILKNILFVRSIFNTLLVALFFAALLYPELEQLASFKILKRVHPMFLDQYDVLMTNTLYTYVFFRDLQLLLGEAQQQCFAADLQSLQSSMVALVFDVLGHLSDEKIERLQTSMVELNYSPYLHKNKFNECLKAYDLKFVPVKKAQKLLDIALKDFEKRQLKEKCKEEKGEKCEEVAERVEEMSLGEGGGDVVKCTQCKKAEKPPDSRFRGGFCSALCREKHKNSKEKVKRCGFCARSQERWKGEGREFLRSGGRVFCSASCRDQWRGNGGRPYQPGDWDCSHCKRNEKIGEQFPLCPECVSDPGFPEPNSYCSEECRDTWWTEEHQAQHLEFELGLPLNL